MKNHWSQNERILLLDPNRENYLSPGWYIDNNRKTSFIDRDLYCTDKRKFIFSEIKIEHSFNERLNGPSTPMNKTTGVEEDRDD